MESQKLPSLPSRNCAVWRDSADRDMLHLIKMWLKVPVEERDENELTAGQLTLNEAKTSIKQARRERFDFLGYSFGPHRLRKNGPLRLPSLAPGLEHWSLERSF